MTFPSIMRRSLIINCEGRFVSAQCLASLLPGHPGYFLMQEDMKDFVTSQPVAGALFSVVLGELCDFSVATFRQKNERYAEGGGDGGLTRVSMREACGLLAEDVALHPDGAGHGVELGQARAWWRRRRRRSRLVGCWGTKRGLSGAMCFS